VEDVVVVHQIVVVEAEALNLKKLKKRRNTRSLIAIKK
jgi:hypothetical protein